MRLPALKVPATAISSPSRGGFHSLLDFSGNRRIVLIKRRFQTSVIVLVEDYTTAFLVSLGVLVFTALVMIWAVWGLVGAGVVGAIADRVTVDINRRRR